MPINKDAMLRYLELDRCLRNTGRTYGINDLIEACNKRLVDQYGEDAKVSRRQIYYDLEFMMDSNGWSAPIEKKKIGRNTYYSYADPNYSINNQGLNDQELNQLKSGMLILQRFKGIPQFEWVNEILAKLESTFEIGGDEELISFQQNEFLQGLEHLDDLFNAVVYKQVLDLEYLPFRAKESMIFEFHPYYLKQFNNRWFLFGRNSDSENILTLPLDRIQKFKTSKASFIPCSINWTDYFDDIFGVSRPYDEEPEKIELWFSAGATPYIQTKPIHGSQKLKLNDDGTSTVSLFLIPNFEFKKLLLSHGHDCKVLEPESLQQEIKELISAMFSLYH